MTKDETIVINKRKAMSDFFLAYSSDIEGAVNTMSKDELIEYLENDIFIGLVSATTGIPEQEFVDFSLEYFRRT